MIEYLIRSAICLVILLAVYHLFLEKEKMHRFNRFFLLFSLGFGLFIPIMTLGIAANPLQPIGFSGLQDFVIQPGELSTPVNINEAATADTTPSYPGTIILIIYSLGACLLLTRFIVNFTQIIKKVKNNSRVRSGDSIFILLKEEVVPHSFFNYIFLNEGAYLKNEIEERIIAHELTHVRQKHSIDIIIAELLKIVFWFNPVFVFYKRAIQLNHEFLADESVVVSYRDVPAYQSLLLQVAGLKTISLANTLNYSLTKKRLEMMKKHTSQGIAMLKELALIPVLIVLVFLFSKTIAQSAGPGGQSSMSKEEFYKGAVIYIDKQNGKSVSKKYEEMAAAEKSNLPAPKSPTVDLITTWKRYVQYPVMVDHRIPEATDAAEQCRIFIDGENVDSSVLDKYQPSDFVSYSNSKKVIKGFTMISVNLFTPKFIKSLTGEAKFMIFYDGQIVAGRFNPPFMVPAKYRQTAVKN